MPGHDAEGMALLHNIRSCPSPPSRGRAPAGIQPWIPAFAGMSGGCRSDLLVKQPSLKQPSLKQPSLKHPTLNQQSLKQANFKQPSFKQPSFKQPSFKQPSFKQPSFKQPSVG